MTMENNKLQITAVGVVIPVEWDEKGTHPPGFCRIDI